MGIFKACDVRGIYPDELDEPAARRIGRAVGTFLQGKKVIVAGDVRPSTPILKQAVIQGITRAGCDVVDAGILPTPAFYFAKKAFGAAGGVMVTASHNPPDHNGFKIILGDLPITESELAQIESLAASGEFASGLGHAEQAEILPDYKGFLISEFADSLQAPARQGREVRVVVDCGNGCYSTTAPEVFTLLGIPFQPLYCEPDGTFPNRSPDSANPRNLSVLSEIVRQSQAQLGIAFDGDGDRVAFADENGRILTSDQVISIIAQHILTAAGDKVVLDIKCSSAVSEVVRSLGGIPIVEKSGHTFIKTRVIEEHATLGGEMSGHLFYGKLGGCDDGLYSALLMTQIVSEHGPLSALASAVPHYANTPDIRVRTRPDPALLDEIAAGFPEDRVSRLDGVRVDFDDGWGLARLSVTEPVITLRFEAKNEQALQRIMDEFLSPTAKLKEEVRKLYRF